jgi:hypothetical protein
MADVYSDLTMSADDATTGPYIPCPSGQHAGVLVGVIDIGTHHEVFPDGKEDVFRQLVLVWEATEVEREDGEPQLLAIQARMSIRQNTKLRGLLEDWLGDEFNPERFDPRTLLGRTALLNVIQKRSNKDRPYHRITTVMGLPPRMPVSTARTAPVFYSTSQGEPPEQLRSFPYVFINHTLRPIIEAIETSAERQAQQARAAGTNGNTNVIGSAPRPQRQPEPEPAPEPKPARATSQPRPVRATPKPTPELVDDTVQRAGAAAAQASRRDQADLIRQAQERFKNRAVAAAAPADRFPFQEDDDPVVADQG